MIKFFNEQIVCANCGFVITQSVTSYDEDECKKSRRNAKQPNVSSRKREYWMENETWQQTPLHLNMKFEELLKELRVSDSIERNMALMLYEITRIAFILSLSQETLVEAVRIYERLAKKCSFKGKSIKALSSAIVYVASKKAGVPCGLREIAHAAGISPGKIFKCCDFVLNQLGDLSFTWTVEAYVRRICMLLGVNEQTADTVNKIMQTISQGGYRNGKSLPGLVSASIYIASILLGEHKTQREIAEVTRATEATIRARYKDIVKKLTFVVLM